MMMRSISAAGICLTVLFLPVSILNTVWVSELPTGALIVFLVTLTYRLADSAGLDFTKNKIRLVILYLGAAALFFITLLFYPPISVLVFTFPWLSFEASGG